jgi:hypothetical protein
MPVILTSSRGNGHARAEGAAGGRSCSLRSRTVHGNDATLQVGWDASALIPIMGLCYEGTVIMGKWMLGEPVNATRWFGTVLIIVGVTFVTRSVTAATVQP